PFQLAAELAVDRQRLAAERTVVAVGDVVEPDLDQLDVDVLLALAMGVPRVPGRRRGDQVAQRAPVVDTDPAISVQPGPVPLEGDQHLASVRAELAVLPQWPGAAPPLV